jgi:dihydrolipoamide dehydrogenase
MLDRVLPQEDPEVSAALEKAVNQAGIETRLGGRVSDIRVVKDQVEVHVESAGGTEQLTAQQALLAASFVPNTEGLGLDQVGVDVSSRGFIEIDQAMQTSRSGIWAVGDVTGKLMLAHVGMAMGVVCAEQIAGKQPRALDYRMMPRATFSRPQVASFGFTQEEAEEAGYQVKVGKFSFRANGKALGMDHEEGWVKIIAEKQYGEILGAHLIGPEVTELLPELTLAQRMELTPQELIQNVHAHPTLGEVVHEAALAVFGDPLHM